jgi:signal peptidase I
MCKHVLKLVNHQRDILPPQGLAAVKGGMEDLRRLVAERAPDEVLEKSMENLGKTADKWIKQYPNAAWRENTEVLLVALAVAMGIRTFFLQPFKIPTGSMQPTLYGVTSVPDTTPGHLRFYGDKSEDFEIPTGWARVRDWFRGVSYVNIKAESDGELEEVTAPISLKFLNLYQSLTVGGKTYSLWFPPDYGESTLEARAGLSRHQFFKAGETIVKLKLINGDHLFVDRVTYNFRKPKRGEIIVFETKGIPREYRETAYWRIPDNQFYIKRLVGLGGERIQLGQDRHLIINGTNRLDSSTSHFEKVYSFDPKQPPQESRYSGHVDGPQLAQFFQGKPDGVEIPESHFMVMGDNTLNSLDSRAWGYFPSTAVIGRAFFVYWPLSDRFGLGYHR